MKRAQNSGFILMEVLVALTLIGIISTITITLIVKANKATSDLQKSLLCYPNSIELGCKAVVLTDMANGCKSVMDGKGHVSPYLDASGSQIDCAKPAP